ncbi:MAG: aspartate carbamoyltransferase catalytic subunit [Oligoflexia bacterium]|nr:aspartate carbamoyltransferase catalytic subunit [Bdellovibrionales bacterium]MYE07354.1 aspartate carbamoyltransferase catalytic subunit [Oligoflexia bacterium]
MNQVNKSSSASSLLYIDDLSAENLDYLLKTAALFKKEFYKTGSIIHCINPEQTKGMVVQLLFAEPSTRTRASFEVACGKLGIVTTSLWNLHFSSMAKGETLEDTFQCLIALKPNMIVCRCGELKAIEAFLHSSSIPVISAGMGTKEHPTQALVDAFTIQEKRGKVEGEKVLIVGDVLHSRVANSNLRLLTRLGAQLGMCTPEALSPVDKQAWKDVIRFSSLEEGIKWADVIMCLRVQRERHSLRNIGFSMAEYRDNYRIDQENMQMFRSDGILLHPGPAVRGVEIANQALNDSRCHIITQVENGTHVRSAIISLMLNLEIKPL